MITFEDFKKMELKVAEVKDVQDHPDADKLYVMSIDVGGVQKQIVAGIKSKYGKEELLHKQIIIVDNLEPAVIRGVESQGMLLAASDKETMAVLTPDRRISCGSMVK